MEAKRRYRNSKHEIYEDYEVEGTSIRKLQAVPDYEEIPYRRRREREEQEQKVLPTRKAPNIDFFSMVVLTVAICVTFIACVKFLNVQSDINSMNKQIRKMESATESLSIKNDAMMDEINDSINLDKIYEVAIEDMGMVYPYNNQVVSYDGVHDNYVRQYGSLTGNEEKPFIEAFISKVIAMAQ